MTLVRKHGAAALAHANTRGTALGLKLGLASVAALLAGCAADGTPLTLTTSAIDGKAEAVKVAKADPACIALTSRIEALRKDGVVERIEKASSGKTSTVNVKRESLAQIAELDKANAEFQAKCSAAPVQQVVTTAPAAAPAPAASAGNGPASQAKAAVTEADTKPVVASAQKAAATEAASGSTPAKN